MIKSIMDIKPKFFVIHRRVTNTPFSSGEYFIDGGPAPHCEWDEGGSDVIVENTTYGPFDSREEAKEWIRAEIEFSAA